MKPDTETALADMIKSTNGPLCIQGGGTRGVRTEGQELSCAALDGITLYEPGALTMVARAGTPLADIETALAAENQRLAFEPMDAREMLGTSGMSTIGGVIAANASGPRRIQGGAARDYALGVRFVDGTGTVIKNGGRVMKNVTGYDIVKLMCGSFGTLGVLTEVSLKVLPRPETVGTLLLRGLSDQQAVSVMSRALASPYEITGAAHCAKIMDDFPVTALRIEGFEASVTYRLEQLKALLKEEATDMQIAPEEMSNWLWDGVRNVMNFAGAEGDVWRISCKPSEAPKLAAAAGAEHYFFDWGGGLIWLRMATGTDMRARLGTFDGHATLVRASAETRAKVPMIQPQAPGVARLSAGLRARFDPRGILNPGLMGPVARGVA